MEVTLDMTNFIEDRHKAFADVLHNNSLEEMKKYCKKYMCPAIGNENVIKAGVLKAIQCCDDFTEEEKELAKKKCIEMGFRPDIRR